MSYLLDTNVISETIRRQQNKSVIRWLEHIPSEALFVSVLTLGEIRKGIERLGDSLLVATALHHELRLVTRNAKDFDYPGLEVVNPWQNIEK